MPWSDVVGLAAGGAAALVVLSCAFVWGLSVFAWLAMARRRPKSPAEIEARLIERGEILPEWKDGWTEARVVSPLGYELAVRGKAGVNGRLALVHHGVGWNWLAGLKYAEFLHRAGYSVVLPDSRGHGHSGGRGTSFGLHEATDLGAVLAWARASFPAGEGVLLLGVSLGAATVLEYAARDAAVRAVVADCSFSSADSILDWRLRAFHFPAFLRRLVIPRTDRLCRAFEGFSIFEASPGRACLESSAAILFIHGLEDDYVPWAMSEAMAARRREVLPEARTELWLVPGAAHAKSHRVGPEAYEARVLAFAEVAWADGAAAAGGAPL